jgi:hypothetical protein
MGDFSIKRADELDSTFGGVINRARASLGVKSFGMQVMNMPPNWDMYPNHDHGEGVGDGTVGQEEVYIPVAGSATLRIGGEEHRIEPGVFARVGPGEKRQIIPGPEGLQVICLGGVPGSAYTPPAWTEVGAPPPQPPPT